MQKLKNSFQKFVQSCKEPNLFSNENIKEILQSFNSISTEKILKDNCLNLKFIPFDTSELDFERGFF
ncbi:hypothetical protein M0811_03855 [Anaeramoeba ignava]|uniref:Uncharacterized protein n=1 Tax=Anaeramoeba ignava TaxID=1746090 RepID=A0A9Q0LYW6_ANAIG|nr:hypothetical protein M0811_03855 [Anaeramoeba ignava]